MTLVSAVMLAIVPLATPRAFVRPGWTSVLLLPEAARLTAWPAPPVPLWWRTVAVIGARDTAVAVLVLTSAVMLAIVPFATPLASVTPGWTSVLLRPVAASSTAWPATGL